MQSFQSQAAHYRTLGIKRGSSWEEIKEAHRQLIRAWHPDKFDSSDPARVDAEERAKQINNAFQELQKTQASEAARNETVHFNKVNLSPDSNPGRTRAMTVESIVVVRDGVVYSVKKMKKTRDSSLRKAFEKSADKLKGVTSGLSSTAEQIKTLSKNFFKSSDKLKSGVYSELNCKLDSRSDDFGVVVHFIEGQRIEQSGTYSL